MNLYTVANLISSLGAFCTFIVFIWAILSWFANSSGIVRDIYRVLDRFVRPYVTIFRRFIPPLGGMDFSPLVAIIVIQIIVQIVVRMLYSLA